MKKQSVLWVLLFTCMASTAGAQQTYDSVLAKKTGADEYGMKQYVMAFLRKGPANITDKTQRSELLKGHMQNIGRLAEAGQLVLAGPMTANTGVEGIYVFNVTTVAEAEALSLTDPAVKAGLFAMEYHPWYATAALMEVVRMHGTLQKKKR
ncbi:MAG TPA: YciI family protein [Sediminibacterium sp.]